LIKEADLDVDYSVNFRPISNLNNVSKLVERLLFPALSLRYLVLPISMAMAIPSVENMR
jgi:hypothetical protein